MDFKNPEKDYVKNVKEERIKLTLEKTARLNSSIGESPFSPMQGGLLSVVRKQRPAVRSTTGWVYFPTNRLGIYRTDPSPVPKFPDKSFHKPSPSLLTH